MSSDSRHRALSDPPTTLSCSFCECTLSEQLLALQVYPGRESSLPDGIPGDGGLTLCPSCASECAELVASWTGHDHPAIAEDEPIGEGYRAATDSCSFCSDPLGDSPLLGIELYRRVGDRLPAYSNYTLCPDCQNVFGKFLQNLQKTIEQAE